MTTTQMKQIVNRYMRIVRELSHSSRVITNHSLLSHPESLLPYSKPLIQEALVKAIQLARNKQDRLQLHGLENGLVFLQAFLPDETAEQQNEHLFNNKAYWTEAETKNRIELNKHHH
jgi:hypothetical protein